MYIYQTTFNNTNIMKKLFLFAFGLILAFTACSKTEQFQLQNETENSTQIISMQSIPEAAWTPNFDEVRKHIDSLIAKFGGSLGLDAGGVRIYSPDEPFGSVVLNDMAGNSLMSNPGTRAKISYIPNDLIFEKTDEYHYLAYWQAWILNGDGTKNFIGKYYPEVNTFYHTVKPSEFVLYKPVLGTRPKIKYPITIISSNTTQGTVSGSVEHGVGTLFEVKAIPAPGYEFDRWEISGGESPSRDPIYIYEKNDSTFVVQLKDAVNDAGMKAYFKATDKVVVNVLAADNNGTVSGGGTFALNQSFTINAIPKEGYKFDHWEKNGVSVPEAGASYTTSASDNTPLTFKAFFTAKTLASIFFENTEGGHVTGTQGTKYVGEPFTITAVPDNGYQFSHWTKNGVIINGAGASYTTTVQNSSSVTFKAHFTAMSQKVNVIFNCFVENSYYNNQTYIEYYNPQGILETISPDLLSNQIEIRKGTSITVYINISKPGEQIYCIFSTQDGEYYDLSAPDLVSSTKTIENINEDFEITLQADNSDFR